MREAKAGTRRASVARVGIALGFFATFVLGLAIGLMLGSARTEEGPRELRATGGSDAPTEAAPTPVVPDRVVPDRMEERFLLDPTPEARSEERSLSPSRSRSGVRGKVVFPKEQEPDSAIVYVLHLSPGRSPDPERLREVGKKSQVGRGDAFAFEWPNLDPGMYLLGAGWRAGGPVAAQAIVQVHEGILEHDLVLPPLDPSEYLILHVLDPAGRPDSDVRIWTGYRRGQATSVENATVVPRGQGSFLVLHPLRRREVNAPSARNFVRVDSENYGRREVEYIEGEATEVTIRFVEPATLDLTLRGVAESGLSQFLEILLQESVPEGPRSTIFSSRTAEAVPDSLGVCRLGPVQPGPYSVEIRIRDAALRNRTVAAAPATLLPGENRLSLDVPPLYRLVVVLEDPKPGLKVALRSTDPAGRETSGERDVGEDGRVTFEFLPAGEYWISLAGRRRLNQVRASLPGPEVVTFRDVPADAMAVTIRDPSGPLAKAGFETGDVVVGANGVAFQGLKDVEMFMASAMSSGSEIRFQVLRGARLLELAVDAQQFRSGDIGGTLEWMIR